MEFVRFCYGRRPVGWPELYDEMCAVAARGAFRGWGYDELAERGIEFSLSRLAGLAAATVMIAGDDPRARGCDHASGQRGRSAATPEPIVRRSTTRTVVRPGHMRVLRGATA